MSEYRLSPLWRFVPRRLRTWFFMWRLRRAWRAAEPVRDALRAGYGGA